MRVTAYLKPFKKAIWTAATLVRFAGIWFEHVMTVLRLANGSVVLHSPCKPTPALFDEIAQVGIVAHVIAPNWFHDLYLREYRDAYPEASFWGPSFLRRQMGSSLINRELMQETQTPWMAEIPHHTISGILTFDESIFFHRPTETLIVADLFTNLRASADLPWFTNVAYHISGINGRLAILPYLRMFGFTERSSLNQAADCIRGWNPKGLIVGHGKPIEDQASELLTPVLRRFSV